jgi:hypothetical protein
MKKPQSAALLALLVTTSTLDHAAGVIQKSQTPNCLLANRSENKMDENGVFGFSREYPQLWITPQA